MPKLNFLQTNKALAISLNKLLIVNELKTNNRAIKQISNPKKQVIKF
jgi:hypothetical protein